MFDLKAEKPVDPKDEEFVKKFLFGPEVTPMPSISVPKRKSCSVDPLDRTLGLGGRIEDKLAFRGVAQLPLQNQIPRLVKRQLVKS